MIIRFTLNMVEITTAQIETTLQGYPLFELKYAHIDGSNVILKIEFGFPMAIY